MDFAGELRQLLGQGSIDEQLAEVGFDARVNSPDVVGLPMVSAPRIAPRRHLILAQRGYCHTLQILI